jgi:hypothetical protein
MPAVSASADAKESVGVGVGGSAEKMHKDELRNANTHIYQTRSKKRNAEPNAEVPMYRSFRGFSCNEMCKMCKNGWECEIVITINNKEKDARNGC